MTEHIAEAIEAARRTEDIREARDADMAAARADRRRAVMNARATMSVQEIADGLGVSRARVYAILSGKE